MTLKDFSRLHRLGCLPSKGLLAFGAFLATTQVVRASSAEGYIGNIVQSSYTSAVYISITNISAGGPSCSGATVFWLTVDSTSSTYPATLAMALSAKYAGASVYVAGNGVCSSGAPNAGISEALAVLYLN